MRSEQSIEEVRRSIATVPWERLAHAYHGAWDAPEHLEIFVSSTASNEALNKSIDWMWGSILHQGSIYSASTPVLWILIDLLAAWPESPLVQRRVPAGSVQALSRCRLEISTDAATSRSIQF